ncbi:MAG: lysophospholipid acyltransferase family protein, partial [Bacteroidales bacterium]|nr:lysophospholipid acyltransferase family protein [Bacteroidales bacterium]
RFKWIMKQEVRKIPFVGAACEAAGHIFINRESAKMSNQSIIEAEKKLKNGASIVMFPEGHRTKDGKLQPFKRGAFHLANDLHLPIIPITIKGAYKVMNVHSFFIHPGKITVKIHPQIDTTQLTHDNINEYADKVKNIINQDL